MYVSWVIMWLMLYGQSQIKEKYFCLSISIIFTSKSECSLKTLHEKVQRPEYIMQIFKSVLDTCIYILKVFHDKQGNSATKRKGILRCATE